MKQLISISTWLIFMLFLLGCNQEKPAYVVSVSNDLQLDRKGETVSLLKSDLGNITCELFSRFSIQDAETGEYLLSQVMDEDMDGELDYLLFQPVLKAGETRTYNLVADVDKSLLPVTEISTYSRV